MAKEINNELRKNITEKAFFEHYDKYGVKKLPVHGKNNIRFDFNGNKIIGERSLLKLTKSLDGIWNDWYITQKHINNNSGGSQDNQIRDVYHTLSYALKGNNKCITCIEGNFPIEKIKELKELENENIKVFYEKEFEKWIKTMLQN
ncbi:MAG: hypothetical protein LBF97_08105 [Elusimicrobiota bacterium]|jgi:hypothetical protein|nr:hypothetical protein [Elusimicrobiota bacterium]